jgi:hypothetical protein
MTYAPSGSNRNRRRRRRRRRRRLRFPNLPRGSEENLETLQSG